MTTFVPTETPHGINLADVTLFQNEEAHEAFRILRAEAQFQQSLERYQQAEAGNNDAWSGERREHVRAAAHGFAQVQEQLYDADHGGAFGVVQAYRARPDHDRQVGDHAAAMAEHTRHLLAAAEAMIGDL